MCYRQPLLHVLDQTYVDLCAKCLEGEQCCKLQAENGSLWASGAAAHVVWHVKVQFSFIKNVQTLNNFAIPSSSVCSLCIHQRLMPTSLEREWHWSVVLTEVTAGICMDCIYLVLWCRNVKGTSLISLFLVSCTTCTFVLGGVLCQISRFNQGIRQER